MTKEVKVREVLKTSKGWDGVPLPGMSSGQTEFQVLVFHMPPGAKTTIHTHPLNGAGYIITGELTMYATEDPHGSFENPKLVKKIKLKPGDGWTERMNVWHYGENQGRVDAEFVLIFVGQEGTHPTLSLGTHPK